MRGAIVLAGGPSRRLGRPKAFLEIEGLPLVLRVVSAAKSVAPDVVVVSRGGIASRLENLVVGVRVVRDARRIQTPLIGLLAGATALRAGYVAALACDLPFLEPAVLSRLFSEARGHDAALPRWPNGQNEPLVAVYRRTALLAAVRASLLAGERSNQEMIGRLRDVSFVEVDSLRAADPALRSFVNVNTPEDLRRARRLARTTPGRAGRPRTR